jgi:hypothetical protein
LFYKASSEKFYYQDELGGVTLIGKDGEKFNVVTLAILVKRLINRRAVTCYEMPKFNQNFIS